MKARALLLVVAVITIGVRPGGSAVGMGVALAPPPPTGTGVSGGTTHAVGGAETGGKPMNPAGGSALPFFCGGAPTVAPGIVVSNVSVVASA